MSRSPDPNRKALCRRQLFASGRAQRKPKTVDDYDPKDWRNAPPQVQGELRRRYFEILHPPLPCETREHEQASDDRGERDGEP